MPLSTILFLFTILSSRSLLGKEDSSLTSKLYYLKSPTLVQEYNQAKGEFHSYAGVLYPEQVASIELDRENDQGIKRAFRVHFKDERPSRLFYLPQYTFGKKIGEISNLQTEVAASIDNSTNPPSSPCPPELNSEEPEPVLQASLSQEIEIHEEDLPEPALNCEAETPESESQNLWDVVKACGGGVLDSIGEILSFVWTIMKWIWRGSTQSVAWTWRNATSSDARSQTASAVSGALSGTSQWASEYMDSAQLYLHAEYQRAYDETSKNLPKIVRKARALKNIVGAMGAFAYSRISQVINDQVEKFQCLPPDEKASAFCHLASSILIPPAGAIALIKFGPKALKQIPKLGRAFSKFKNDPRVIAAIQKSVEASKVAARNTGAAASRLGQSAENVLSKSSVGRKVVGVVKGAATVGKVTLIPAKGVYYTYKGYKKLVEWSDRLGIPDKVAQGGYQVGKLAAKGVQGTMQVGQRARQGLANTGEVLKTGAKKAGESSARSRRFIADSAGFIYQTAGSAKKKTGELFQRFSGSGSAAEKTAVAGANKSELPASSFGLSNLKVRSEVPTNSPLNSANALKVATPAPNVSVRPTVSPAIRHNLSSEVWDEGLRAWVPPPGQRRVPKWGWTATAGEIFWDGKKWIRPPHTQYAMEVNRLKSPTNGFYGMTPDEQKTYDKLYRSFRRRYRNANRPSSVGTTEPIELANRNVSAPANAPARPSTPRPSNPALVKPKAGRQAAITVEGNAYNAEIVELLGKSNLSPSGPNRVRVRYSDRQGHVWEKVVEEGHLYRPLRVPNGHLGIGDEISYIRSFGRKSTGKVESVQGGRVKVSFTNWRGRQGEEWVPLKDILPETPPRPISPSGRGSSHRVW